MDQRVSFCFFNTYQSSIGLEFFFICIRNEPKENKLISWIGLLGDKPHETSRLSGKCCIKSEESSLFPTLSLPLNIVFKLSSHRIRHLLHFVIYKQNKWGLNKSQSLNMKMAIHDHETEKQEHCLKPPKDTLYAIRKDQFHKQNQNIQVSRQHFHLRIRYLTQFIVLSLE